MDNTSSELISVNFIIDHDTLDFISYEFTGEEVYVEEAGSYESLFRVQIQKDTNEIYVNVAYSEDFDVMEDVSEHFDIDELVDDVMRYVKNNEVDNIAEDYIKYCELRDKGYQCDEAMSVIFSSNQNSEE